MSELTVGSLSGLAANSYVIDVASGSSLDLSNGAVFPAGSIIQVVSTTKTDAFSTTSGTFVDVTGLSVSITPSATTSKIFVIAQVHHGHSAAGDGIFNIVRDSTAIAQPTVGTQQSSFSSRVDGNTLMEESGMSVLDSPSTTSAVTYKIQMAVPAGGTTGYVNRRGADTYVATVSTITAMEVAG